MIQRIEPELTEQYRKDPEIESFLSKLNHILAPYQEEDYLDNLPEKNPIVHIIGVPRSGTTLLTQLLATHTDIGYINNLIAAFWQAPVYGISLSQKTMPRNIYSSFQSDFGRTSGIHEPHEFGYFWSSLLGYREMSEQNDDFEKNIDWKRVRLVLSNVVHAYRRPVIFKSFLLGWHIQKMQEVMQKTCWIHIRRDPIQNALSLLKFRREFIGDVNIWGSLKPLEYEWLQNRSYCEQVAGQVYFLEMRYEAQLRALPKANVLRITYDELCQNPHEILNRIKGLVIAQGSDINISTTSPVRFIPTINDVDTNPDALRIKEAWSRFQQHYSEI